MTPWAVGRTLWGEVDHVMDPTERGLTLCNRWGASITKTIDCPDRRVCTTCLARVERMADRLASTAANLAQHNAALETAA